MSGALVRKEWREHRGAWLLFGVLFGPALFLLSWWQSARLSWGSPFEGLRLPTVALTTVGAFFVAHRLVVGEYGQRTQLFLESLPLSRARILTTKLVFGAVVLLLPLLVHLGVLAYQARNSEDVPLSFLLLLLLRTGTVVMLGWSLLALSGLLGRYRFPLLLLLLVALFLADHLSQFDITRAAPLQLLGRDLAFERHRVPWRALGICWALGSAMTLLGFGLVLFRDGTLTELLSQRMSHREKVFIASILTGLLSMAAAMAEEKQREPFVLNEAERAAVGSSTLQVASGVGFPPERARALAQRLARNLGTFGDYLALERMPAVAVMPNTGLDADVFQRAKLEKKDGVVIRAHLAAPDFDEDAFEAFLFREVLIELSDGIVQRERRQWLLDGFTTWWVNRSEPGRLSRGAAVGSREDVEEREWLSTRERLGPCVAGVVAARGIQVLRDRLGDAAFQSLMRRTLAFSPSTGFLGLWREPRLDSLLRELGESSEEEVGRLWRDALRADRAAHPEVLASLAMLHPTLSLVAESPETFRLEHGLSGGKGPDAPTRYALLYAKLEPFENEVEPHAFSRQDARVSPEGARLPLGLSRGDRWLFVMQVESAALRCPVRLLTRRGEVR
ncbi:ABC transporter permease [Melittangium boletus]|uniref:Uncharacterized protein n=1 Tax=Melittangium boletus DSM 14713 TaxID=1294270 RepID=A0A286NV48_9BACT|nr:ABC transporter permease [Melittangium boletus]ATB26947.1 hypothetical protein MEBOL_000382 [Melittangium boletus DSM 14713]